MNNQNIKLAIISPARNVYSETFIQAHKEMVNDEVFYYYGGHLPRYLEAKYSFISGRSRLINALKAKVLGKFESGLEYALYHSFKKEKIDVVLAEYGPTGEAVLSVCKASKLPLIVHFHGYDASRFKTISDHAEYKNIFEYAHKVIVVSQVMSEKLIKLGCSKDKIVLNPCGPNQQFFKLRPSCQSHTFIGIGRFVDKKAPYYTILAMSEVLKSHPDARLILAGEGPLKNMCQNLVSYLGLEKVISFPGIISSDEYRVYLKDSLAFVQHSVTAEDGDMEGTPVAILEASAAGLPVVSTRHAGIPDVIQDGVTGFLVNEHDVMGMTNAMLKCLENPLMAKRMGELGKENIRTYFSMERHIGIIDELVNSAFNYTHR